MNDRDRLMLTLGAFAAMGVFAIGLNVLGPASAPMLRRANQYHAQLLLQSASRRALNAALLMAGPQLAAQARVHKVRFSVDVDPIDLY